MSLDWRRWLGMPVPQRTALATARWVVVDVETTGLDVHRDRLLAIGAIGVKGNALVVADSFEAILRQEAASNAANILVHRITGTEQRSGIEAGLALDDFMAYSTRDEAAGFVGYHAAFDEAILRHACQLHRRKIPPSLPFLDLAELAPALLPGVLPAKAALDDWLAYFGIRIARRHHAVADALGTAQLFVQLVAVAQRQGARKAADLFDQARAQRWIARGG